MAKTTIGVILSGSGYLDGSEIQESVLVLLSLAKHGATAKIFAPDMTLKEVDHVTKAPTGAERSLLKEAARIARSNVHDLAKAKGTDVDGWILPGGFGAAKNLSDFATKGAQATVNKEVNRVMRDAFAGRTPIGACCMAPVVLALVAKGSSTKLRLTIGNDKDTAKAINSMGHTHIDTVVTDIVIDIDRKVVTTPAYMFDAAIDDVAAGIDKMVKQVVDWSREELSAPRNAPPFPSPPNTKP